MDEKSLFEIFYEERIEDLQVVVLRYGVVGLVEEFEGWLRGRELIDTIKEDALRNKL